MSSIIENLPLTGQVVYLPIERGEKGPKWKGWRQKTVEDMADVAYLKRLEASSNIGVLLGGPSGCLCVIDIDDDSWVEPFIAINPILEKTLRTKGSKGCALWVRMNGPYPPPGKARNTETRDVIEWRSDGQQQVIHGVHPKGMEYKILVAADAITIDWKDIFWPPGLITNFKEEPPEELKPRMSILDRARKYLSEIPPAVQGNSGSSQTLEAARILVHDFALSNNEAWNLLQEYNARCVPPWNYKDLLRKLAEAERLGGIKPKGHLAENKPPPLSSPSQEKKSSPTPSSDEHPASIDCWYDSNRKEYLMKDGRANWQSLNDTQVKRRLKAAGYSVKPDEGQYVSAIDKFFTLIEQERNVSYAGPLAGYMAGYHEEGEHRLLVTQSPKIPVPVAGDWSTLYDLIHGLLAEDVGQIEVFYGWLKVAYEALSAGKRRPGQAMVLCGPHGCGKSLLQNLMTVMLGGRGAKPYQFMSGVTPFNGNLFYAECLLMEDEQPSKDYKSRRNFGNQIKSICVNETQNCHDKFQTALTLRPFWRLIVSCNNNSENIQILPPMDESMTDKIIMFNCRKSGVPFPTNTMEARAEFWRKLVSEIPAFIHFLTQYQIPEALVCPRFGVAHYHHPEILQELEETAPELLLLDLIDDIIFDEEENPMWHEFEGSSSELEKRIRDVYARKIDADRVFSFSNACGIYLSRLAIKFPTRFYTKRTKSKRIWTIKK